MAYNVFHSYPQCFNNLPGSDLLCSWWWVRGRHGELKRTGSMKCCGKFHSFPCPTQGEKPVVEES